MENLNNYNCGGMCYKQLVLNSGSPPLNFIGNYPEYKLRTMPTQIKSYKDISSNRKYYDSKGHCELIFMVNN